MSYLGSYIGALVSTWLLFFLIEFLYKRMFKEYYKDIALFVNFIISNLIATGILSLISSIEAYNSYDDENFKKISIILLWRFAAFFTILFYYSYKFEKISKRLIASELIDLDSVGGLSRLEILLKAVNITGFGKLEIRDDEKSDFEKIKTLRDKNLITEQEYVEAKKALLLKITNKNAN
ncbi:MAG: hypothetical protein Q7U04_02840 [Bacteriovorax sp.]|nr:hypothetical protein [Bacteriovorax sp.]